MKRQLGRLAAGRGRRSRRNVRRGSALAGRSAEERADRLRHLAQRRERARRRRHHAVRLQAVGRRRQQEGRPAGQGIQQADSDRGHRIRRHQQCRDRGAAGRAADDPGQGRFRAAALEHRLQPGDRAGVRAQRLPATRGDGQFQRLGSARQADAHAVLLPQRAAQLRRRARRGAEQAQEREQDQQQGRDAQRRPPVRRRAHRPASHRCCRRRASSSCCARPIRSAPPISPTRSRRPRPPAPTPSSPTAIRPTPSC